MLISGSYTRVINKTILKELRKDEDSARNLLIFTTHPLQSSSWLFTGQLDLRMLNTIKKKKNAHWLLFIKSFLSCHYPNN